MPINISFAGARIARTGAFSTVDTDGMVPITLGAFNVLAFVGTMDAASTIEPRKAVYFNDPALARKALKRGEYLEAVETAWGHTADLIAFVRVDTATQATGAIADVFDVKAKDFGTSGNDITYDVDVDVESGEVTMNFARGEDLEQFTIVSGAKNEEIARTVSRQSRFVTLVAKKEGAIEAPLELTNLTGGAGGGPVTDEDWQNAIDVLSTEDVQGIVPVTAEPAIIAKVDAHITNMSSVKNRKERRGFYGHKKGAPIAEIISLKTMVNNQRALIATPAPYTFGESGELELRDSVLTAAAIAGLWSSKEPQDPVTYDYVKFPELEKRYDSVEIEQLLAGGITPVEFVRNKGNRIVQGITTYTGPDLSQAELSVSTLKDVMSINIREHLEEKYVGKAGVKGIDITIKNDAVTLIGKFEKAGWISGYDPESVKVRRDGTAFWVDWVGYPTLPINNFLITSHFKI